MFGNLKSKLGDVADLKKLATPQGFMSFASGSRQMSGQETPVSDTNPKLGHSRQTSTASLASISASPPQSPLVQNLENHVNSKSPEKSDTHREIMKLRVALESQQDVALQRLNAKEQEWKAKDNERVQKLMALELQLKECKEKESSFKTKRDSYKKEEKMLQIQLQDAFNREKDLEDKLFTLHENYDQLEGLGVQECAKIKHLLLARSSELEAAKLELENRTARLADVEVEWRRLVPLEALVRCLGEEKMELETQVEGLKRQLDATAARHKSESEEHLLEFKRLQERLSHSQLRNSQSDLTEGEKVQALIKEREDLERHCEEIRQQLSNIKSSWSEKIASLETQINNLNMKMAEDQSDMKKLEDANNEQSTQLIFLKNENKDLLQEKITGEQISQMTLLRVQEDVVTLRWQLGEQEMIVRQLTEQLEYLEKQKEIDLNEIQEHLLEITSLKQHGETLESECEEALLQLTLTGENLQKERGETGALQEVLRLERDAKAEVEEELRDVRAKLDTVAVEKGKLAAILDQYAERQIELEEKLKMMEGITSSQSEIIIQLEKDGLRLVDEIRILKEEMGSMEQNCLSKLEVSDLVVNLRSEIVMLQQELSEKKQALRMQAQRLTDMKKTIQRELKITPDVGLPDASFSEVPFVTTMMNSPQNSRRSGGHHSMGYESFTNGVVHDDEPINIEYLKHVIIKFLTSREYEAVHLTRAVATLLQMTSEEERLVRETLEWKMSWFGPKPNLGQGQLAKTIPSSQ